MRPLRSISELILEMLVSGMNRGDERVKFLCDQAMQAFCPEWFDPPDHEHECCVFEEPEPPPLKTALTSSRISWTDARPAVVVALQDSLRLEDRQLNIRAIHVATEFPDRIIDTLIANSVCHDITVDHCRRLLEAIHGNGATICQVGANVLRHLEDKPGFEEVWPWARMLIRQRREMVVKKEPSIGAVVRFLASQAKAASRATTE